MTSALLPLGDLLRREGRNQEAVEVYEEARAADLQGASSRLDAS